MKKRCEGFPALRLPCQLGGLLLFCSASATAQSVQEVLPLEKTVDGITLSIRKAGFYTGTERRRLSFDPNEDLQKGRQVSSLQSHRCPWTRHIPRMVY